MKRPSVISVTFLRQHFSSVLSEVEQGATYIITRYGKPVAVLVPYRGEDE